MRRHGASAWNDWIICSRARERRRQMKLIECGSDNTLQISHILNVPRNVAFTWWSDSTKLERWIGCKAVEQCEIAMDFRVGGSFIQTMHVSGRGVFRITGIYEEIVVPERIAYRAA